MSNCVTLTIEAKDMPHGMTVRKGDFPPKDQIFISSEDQEGNKLYFLTYEAEKGYVSSDFEHVPADMELDIQFKGLGEALDFVKKYNLENIWQAKPNTQGETK